ncbi:MAG: tetratricopeptide repeat protein, partial [Planctomycetaceae bacterium]|nr:tetratricopeptide repeat protein [Planctomycetaceae bacterium]
YADKVLAAENPSPEALATALYINGTAAFDLEQTAKAAELFENLVRIRRYGYVWYQLSLCRDRLGNHAGALEAAEKAVEITPQGPRLHDWLAELYERAGQKQKARASARRAAELAAAAEATEHDQARFAD